MLVRALMLPKEELVIADIDESLETALRKIEERNFLSIPVVDGKKFLGFISKEKIYEEYFQIGGDRQEYLKSARVRKVIRTAIPSLRPQDEVEKAAHTLENYGVPFLAVINDNDEFEGIITHYAIFREFANALGIDRGSKISVIAYDIPGQVSKLSEVITKNGGDILSFVVLDPKTKTEVKEIVVRVKAEKFTEIVNAVKAAGFRVQ